METATAHMIGWLLATFTICTLVLTAYGAGWIEVIINMLRRIKHA